MHKLQPGVLRPDNDSSELGHLDDVGVGLLKLDHKRPQLHRAQRHGEGVVVGGDDIPLGEVHRRVELGADRGVGRGSLPVDLLGVGLSHRPRPSDDRVLDTGDLPEPELRHDLREGDGRRLAQRRVLSRGVQVREAEEEGSVVDLGVVAGQRLELDVGRKSLGEETLARGGVAGGRRRALGMGGRGGR